MNYIYLINLLDHNETLFYRPVMSDPAYFLPIVYDPTIGEACLKFGHIYRQARGMYLSMTRRGKVKENLHNWPPEGCSIHLRHGRGRILGLGDLGANGAGIPIGKLQLYTACAAVPPQYLMPRYLDAGTNNEQYLRDPLYLGMRKPRPPTAELNSFVDEFMEAVQEVLQNAASISRTGLEWTPSICSSVTATSVYNDDVQGTAGITLADFQKPYAHPHAPSRHFVEAIEDIRPTTIIGVSTIGGAFTQQVVEAMSRINGRPVILALSNPTEKAECTPEQAYTWSNGKAIYAAGVPFPPVQYKGQTFLPGQANNFYIFPAVSASPTRCSSKPARR